MADKSLRRSPGAWWLYPFVLAATACETLDDRAPHPASHPIRCAEIGAREAVAAMRDPDRVLQRLPDSVRDRLRRAAYEQAVQRCRSAIGDR